MDNLDTLLCKLARVTAERDDLIGKCKTLLSKQQSTKSVEDKCTTTPWKPTGFTVPSIEERRLRCEGMGFLSHPPRCGSKCKGIEDEIEDVDTCQPESKKMFHSPTCGGEGPITKQYDKYVQPIIVQEPIKEQVCMMKKEREMEEKALKQQVQSGVKYEDVNIRRQKIEQIFPSPETIRKELLLEQAKRLQFKLKNEIKPIIIQEAINIKKERDSGEKEIQKELKAVDARSEVELTPGLFEQINKMNMSVVKQAINIQKERENEYRKIKKDLKAIETSANRSHLDQTP